VEKDQPFFCDARPRQRMERLFLFLRVTPVVVLLLLYDLPWILLNETFARWSLRGVVLLWLLMIAWESYSS
jgi:hypothetical protein